MMRESYQFSYIQVSSELEALLLESKLVNELQTKFNSQLKDDKHPLYIKITKEIYPRVITVRKRDINDKSLFFGPFTSAASVKKVLAFIRNVFPFSNHKIGKDACIYNQIGLCNPCPNHIAALAETIEKTRLTNIYRNNIFMIKTFLSGNLGKVMIDLNRKIKTFSDNLDFESANEVLSKIHQIEYITQPITPTNYFLENPNLIEDIRRRELQELSRIINNYYSLDKNIIRIECYDIAHLSGTYPTASMVTFIDAEPDKNLYRHFRILQKKGNDDISSLREIAQRRLKYLEKWGRPDLIVVDGGKAQLKVFMIELKEIGIPIVALAKREETLIYGFFNKNRINYKSLKLTRGPAKYLLQRVRNEAHRFARRYHFTLIRKMLLYKSEKS